MSRGVLALDRIILLLLGIFLVAVGAASIVWGTKQVGALNGSVDLSPLVQATEKSWWPWAVGAGGLVLVLLGLRWLFSHLRTRGTGPIRLPGSDRSGRLTADTSPVADAAADAFTDIAGVKNASGRVIRDRGQIVARLSATIDPAADLHDIAAGADQVSSQLRSVLGRDDLYCRIHLRLANKSSLSRVQ